MQQQIVNEFGQLISVPTQDSELSCLWDTETEVERGRNYLTPHERDERNKDFRALGEPYRWLPYDEAL